MDFQRADPDVSKFVFVLFIFLGARAGCAGLGCRLGFFAEKAKRTRPFASSEGVLRTWRRSCAVCNIASVCAVSSETCIGTNCFSFLYDLNLFLYLFIFFGARAGCAGLGCRLGFFARNGKKNQALCIPGADPAQFKILHPFV